MSPLDWVALLALLLGPSALGTWRAGRAWFRRRRRLRPPGPPGVVEEKGDDGAADAADAPKSKPMGVVAVGLSLLARSVSLFFLVQTCL